MNLKTYLKKHKIIVDGSMGTYYSTLKSQPGAISEFANWKEPDIIKQIHKEYIAAGANLIHTNTFAANRAVLGIPATEQKELVKIACQLAQSAVKESVAHFNQGYMQETWIAGDLGPIPETAKRTDQEILEEYQSLCQIFIEEGVDAIHFETFSKLDHLENLVSFVKEKCPNIFIIVSFAINKNGYTAAGISANRILDQMSNLSGIDACGFNCGVGAGHMGNIVKKLVLPEEKYLYIAPNAGYPEQMQNRMVFMDNGKYFGENMGQIAHYGVDFLGGCCGTTPEHIKTMVANVNIRNSDSVNHKKNRAQAHTKIRQKKNEFLTLMEEGKKVIAVELDPPFHAEIDQFMEQAHHLKSRGVDIITFADSPMGRSRIDSILMSIKIATETGMKVMPHICCRDRNMIAMRSTLLGAYIHGIRNLLVVTGDPVPGESRVSTTGVFDYNSFQLMNYMNEMNVEHFAEDPMVFGGALNYGRGSIEKIVHRMKKKKEAGASYFLTQPIYSKEDVERIQQIKQQIDTKIICGIMPFVSYRNACFIQNEITGIHVPEDIVQRYRPDMKREEAEEVGASIAYEVMVQLKDIADGYYFMLPFNRVSLMDKIIDRTIEGGF